MPSNHLILCCPSVLPSILPSIKVFSNESTLHIRWPKYWSFSFSFSPSNEYSGLISFRIDWFDLLAVQGTLKSLLLHHSLKAFILWRSAFCMVLLSHPYMVTGKTIGFSSCDMWAQQLQLLVSRAQAPQLWCAGLAVLQYVGSSQTRDLSHVSCIGDRLFITEPPGKPQIISLEGRPR